MTIAVDLGRKATKTNKTRMDTHLSSIFSLTGSEYFVIQRVKTVVILHLIKVMPV